MAPPCVHGLWYYDPSELIRKDEDGCLYRIWYCGKCGSPRKSRTLTSQ